MKNKIFSLILCLCIVSTVLASCSPNNNNSDNNNSVLKNPVKSTDSKLPGKSKTVWNCVYFGEYPTSEVADENFSAADKYAVNESDIIIDKELYNKLLKAGWNNDETEIDGKKFRRLKSDTAENNPQHYQWNDESYHFFRYEPIKWRVIDVSDNIVTLMSDRLTDCVPYNTKAESVFWESCTLRSFLNGYGADKNNAGIDFAKNTQDSFFATAFSESEKKFVVKSKVKNPKNYYFGTKCGGDTEDYVFIFDEEEIFSTSAASNYGFTESDGTMDCARRFKPTLYAMARGAWYSPVEGNEGNGFWFLRTNGYTASNANYICDFGSVYNRGTYVTVNDAGVLPVIRVDLKTAKLKNAGNISSDDIYKEVKDVKSSSGNNSISPPKKNNEFGFSEPIVEKDETLSGGLKTTWDCLLFGSYPIAEVVSSDNLKAVDDYAVDDGDIIKDADLYVRLLEAEWKNNEAEIDGEKYRRITAKDTVSYTKSEAQRYKWDSEENYHYFKYQPVKWRIIELNGSEAFLLADREMDCIEYNTFSEDVTWSNCTLRSFLNGYDETFNRANISFAADKQKSFFNTAFTDKEKSALIRSKVENPDNSYYKTDCGDTTEDYVFILSADEVFASPSAARHGFYYGSGVDDPARRFRPTMYAKARGTWYSPVEGYKGNGFWYMRTNGYSQSNATYICDFGYIYNRGTDVTCNDSGVLPAIRIDLSKANAASAGTVSDKK